MLRKLLIAASAIAALGLAGCQTTSGGGGLTTGTVAAAIAKACGLVAPLSQIASLVAASNPAVTTAETIAAIVCSTAQSVIASTTPKASRLGGALGRPVTVIVNGVTLNLSPK